VFCGETIVPKGLRCSQLSFNFTVRLISGGGLFMKTRANSKKSVWKIILEVIAWIVVIFATIITLSVFSSQANGGVANIFGKIPVTIQSDSMAPTFKAGDLIIDKKVTDIKQLKEGDVITFWTIIQGKRVLNTHRIVNINNDGSYITRGDANSKEDDVRVLPLDIVGQYTGQKISGMGSVIDFLRSPTGFLIFVVLPLLIFFIYQVYRFVVIIISMKKPKLSAADEEEIKRKAIEEYIKSQEQQDSVSNQP
jgi:signal peptidase